MRRGSLGISPCGPCGPTRRKPGRAGDSDERRFGSNPPGTGRGGPLQVGSLSLTVLIHQVENKGQRPHRARRWTAFCDIKARVVRTLSCGVGLAAETQVLLCGNRGEVADTPGAGWASITMRGPSGPGGQG